MTSLDGKIRRACLADAAGISDVLKRAFVPYRALYTPEAFAVTVPGPEGVVS